ncbi:hypothetical protein Axy23_049 [Achromobacter phage vB_AxyP_19-32_Axy23]|uniref:Uncharacterized protein n=1 Tax=Achromobacter phage vB_AxyP_19-32_Axy23 TaxID=2591047 RepID=A0A514CW15_9CAUD|nr:hypothetical protein Axy23_049 [Achromobacter phage vB_AxyP_19-32_Axy23]
MAFKDADQFAVRDGRDKAMHAVRALDQSAEGQPALTYGPALQDDINAKARAAQLALANITGEGGGTGKPGAAVGDAVTVSTQGVGAQAGTVTTVNDAMGKATGVKVTSAGIAFAANSQAVPITINGKASGNATLAVSGGNITSATAAYDDGGGPGPGKEGAAVGDVVTIKSRAGVGKPGKVTVINDAAGKATETALDSATTAFVDQGATVPLTINGAASGNATVTVAGGAVTGVSGTYSNGGGGTGFNVEPGQTYTGKKLLAKDGRDSKLTLSIVGTAGPDVAAQLVGTQMVTSQSNVSIRNAGGTQTVTSAVLRESTVFPGLIDYAELGANWTVVTGGTTFALADGKTLTIQTVAGGKVTAATIT